MSNELATIWDDFTGFWANTVWPGLKNLFRTTITNEVTALAPIAESVVAEIENDLKNAASLKDIASIVGSAFNAVASQAEAAAVSAGAASLITAVSSAFGNLLSSSAEAPVVPAPEPTPEPVAPAQVS